MDSFDLIFAFCCSYIAAALEETPLHKRWPNCRGKCIIIEKQYVVAIFYYLHSKDETSPFVFTGRFLSFSVG
jgi:hypothetical protein